MAVVTRPQLHVIFTLDCPPAGARVEPHGPVHWEASARAIDAFCTTLLNAGFAPTLFLTPEAVEEHTPLCDDLLAAGADLGLFIQPQTVRGAQLRHYLGAYPAAQQRMIVAEALQRFEQALERRPLSVRSAMYSASDETFGVLSQLGFRQCSLSSPGRRVKKHGALWQHAPADPHYTSATSRLEPGTLPLLEVPVTTDATQNHGGLAPDLAIENGTVERWHRPLIAAQLERHEREQITFRVLCFVTSTRFPYYDRSSRYHQTLDQLLDHLLALDERYEVMPATLGEVATRYHQHAP